MNDFCAVPCDMYHVTLSPREQLICVEQQRICQSMNCFKLQALEKFLSDVVIFFSFSQRYGSLFVSLIEIETSTPYECAVSLTKQAHGRYTHRSFGSRTAFSTFLITLQAEIGGSSL